MLCKLCKKKLPKRGFTYINVKIELCKKSKPVHKHCKQLYEMNKMIRIAAGVEKEESENPKFVWPLKFKDIQKEPKNDIMQDSISKNIYDASFFNTIQGGATWSNQTGSEVYENIMRAKEQMMKLQPPPLIINPLEYKIIMDMYPSFQPMSLKPKEEQGITNMLNKSLTP